MEIIEPTVEMIKESLKLNTGSIMVVYKDHNTIRMETELGMNPYVWRNNTWREMK